MAGTAPLDLCRGVTLDLVTISAGTFTMGSDDADSSADEKPPHIVTFSETFHLGRTAVTVGQFRRFVAATGYKTVGEADGKGAHSWPRSIWEQKPGLTWKTPGFDQPHGHPVVCVSWKVAVAFCAWASKQAGRIVYLPSEAQWEYASRAGAAGKFCFGDDLEDLDKYAWFVGNRDGGFTRPVATKRQNAWGLFDVHGNVWEWCRDAMRTYENKPVTDPDGISAGGSRVRRGGSFCDEPRLCRAAFRSGFFASARSADLGFRVSVVR